MTTINNSIQSNKNFIYFKYDKTIYKCDYNDYIFNYLKICEIICNEFNNHMKNIFDLEILIYKDEHILKNIYIKNISCLPLFTYENILNLIIIVKKLNNTELNKYFNKFIKILFCFIIKVLDYDNEYINSNYNKNIYFYGQKYYDYRTDLLLYDKIYKDIIDSKIYNIYENKYNIGKLIDNIFYYCENNKITILKYIKTLFILYSKYEFFNINDFIKHLHFLPNNIMISNYNIDSFNIKSNNGIHIDLFSNITTFINIDNM